VRRLKNQADQWERCFGGFATARFLTLGPQNIDRDPKEMVLLPGGKGVRRFMEREKFCKSLRSGRK
jgi:hypothetical protein